MLKRILLSIALSTLTLMSSAQYKITLTNDGRSMTATLVDNTATRELYALLLNGPLIIQMNDYGGFEKVGVLPQHFTTSNSQITTEPGDIMLYQGNNMVIFYDSNSWSYTRLGKIDGATHENVRQFLGKGSISLSISLPSSGIDDIHSVHLQPDVVYNTNGQPVISRPLKPGLYIINGKKALIK